MYIKCKKKKLKSLGGTRKGVKCYWKPLSNRSETPILDLPFLSFKSTFHPKTDPMVKANIVFIARASGHNIAADQFTKVKEDAFD